MALKAGFIFCLFLASMSPAKLKERSTRAAVVGNHMYGATASYISVPVHTILSAVQPMGCFRDVNLLQLDGFCSGMQKYTAMQPSSTQQ